MPVGWNSRRFLHCQNRTGKVDFTILSCAKTAGASPALILLVDDRREPPQLGRSTRHQRGETTHNPSQCFTWPGQRVSGILTA
jgi:hypothetical protein